MTQIEVLKRNIRSYLYLLSDQVVKNNAKGLLNINIESEDTVAKLLNKVFAYNLTNANDKTQNYPGIDLKDDKNKIAIQVTSNISSEKVKKTCTTFIKYKYYNFFNRLLFYYITNKSVHITPILKRNVNNILLNYISFDFNTDIMNNMTVLEYIYPITELQIIIDIERLLSDKYSLPNGGRMDPVRGYIIPKRLNSYAGYSINELVGRIKVLDSIHELFQNKTTVLITGLGGIGKTTVARAYLEQHRNTYDHLAYVDISGNLIDSILQRLANIDNSFDINPDLTPLQNLHTLIEKIRTIPNTLLVIDNCNNETELREIKPILESLEWKILITSRSKPQNFINEVIEIGPLSPDEALQLFTNFYKTTDTVELNTINQIITKAYYHTKLIILLAKAARNNPLLELDILADKVAKSAYQEKSIDINVDLDTEERSVYEFILALFEPDKLDPYSKYYLRFFSVLPSQEISISHLYELFEKQEERKQGYLINTLNKLVINGWIEKYSNDYYRIHPLVQLIVQRKLKPTPEDCHNLIKNIHYLLYTSIDIISLSIYLPYCESIVEFFRVNPDREIALILNKMVYVYRALVQYDKAFEANYLALNIFNNINPKFPEAEAQSYGELMKSFSQIGKYKEAIIYGKKCLEIQEKILPAMHPDLAATYTDISRVFRQNYQSEFAYYYVTKAINIQKWIYHNHYNDKAAINLINAYNSLAALLADTGRAEGKKHLIIRALFVGYRGLIVAKRFLPTDHQNLATIYNDISLTLRDLNCLEKSMTYLEESIKINIRILSGEHPNMALNYYNMAILYKELNEIEKAIYYAQKAIFILENIFLPEHSSVLATKELISILQERL